MCARSIGEYTVGAERYFLTIQVSNAVSAVPIFPGGFGLRDLINKVFLEGAGAAGETAKIIPLFFTFVIITWTMVGGIVFIFFRNHIEDTEEPS